MANRLKSGKKAAPKPEQLKPEKEEKVSIRQITADERTHKILGTVMLLIALFLFIAFSSYVFTWREDQDKVSSSGVRYLFGDNIEAANLLGRFGAWVSHLFIYRGFGLASFCLSIFFFALGMNLLFGRRIFPVGRVLLNVVWFMLLASILLAYFFPQSGFSWGGAFGEMVSEWLNRFIGRAGTGALLGLTLLALFIWWKNPSFRLPERKEVEEEKQVEVDEVKVEVEEEVKAEVEAEKVEGNRLKNGSGVVVIPPKEINDVYANGDMKLIERDEPEAAELPATEEEIALTKDELADLADFPIEMEETIEPAAPPVHVIPPSKKAAAREAAELELEINTAPPPADEETVPEAISGTVADLYEPTLDLRDYKYPVLDLLELHGSEKIVQDPSELEANKNQIINTLKNYDIAIQKIMATVGPTVTLYEIVPAAGVRISRIKNLEDDIALSLAALGIRIIAPIPGKGTIGIEVPNAHKTVVSMRSMLSSEKFLHNSFSLPIAVGKKIDNENYIVDLAAMPHLLMAGATGQGKSVGLNAILVSLLYKKHPSQLKLVLVDPKKVELSLYRMIEKHFLAKLPGEEDAIITDTKKVINTLNALCIEMDNRYDLLKEAGARNIKEYNEKFIHRKLNPQKGHQYLPFIVLVVDEFADLIMTAGKEVEMPIARLAQLARAVGIHLIIATQRPSVNIITGTIKANFPARIAFKVSSKVDSRTILDTGGAEQLIGKGDMLISYNGELTRLQCAFVDTPEVDRVTDFIGDQRGYPQAFLLPEYVDEKELDSKDFDSGNRDPLFEDAARLIVQNQLGSTSLLQRRMKLGYNRAGRLMDQLESAGIVGPNQGSKARDVLIKTESELNNHLELLG